MTVQGEQHEYQAFSLLHCQPMRLRWWSNFLVGDQLVQPQCAGGAQRKVVIERDHDGQRLIRTLIKQPELVVAWQANMKAFGAVRLRGCCGQHFWIERGGLAKIGRRRRKNDGGW